MRFSSHVVSAIRAFISRHGRHLPLAVSTAASFFAALLVGFVATSGADPLCNSNDGPNYQYAPTANPCSSADTSCASSGPGYTCTVNGAPVAQYYTFGAFSSWALCLGTSESGYSCYYQTVQQECGATSYYPNNTCTGNCTPNINWYFVTCEAMQP